jgi:hypothetical protein
MPTGYRITSPAWPVLRRSQGGNKMQRYRTLAAALTVIAAIAAIAAATAQATSAPYWFINGTRLAAGKTHFISLKPVSAKLNLTTPALGIEISCTGSSLKEGVLLGSNENNPGTNNEVLVWTGCKLEKGNGFPECKLTSETLTTNSLRSELVEKAAAPKILLAEFFPVKQPFITLHFEGKCEFSEASLEGSFAAEVTTDNTAEETVELGQAAKQATSWRLRFPNVENLKIILIKEGVASEVKTELTFEAAPTILTGVALISLAKKNGSEPEEVNWSPLP